jgi:hypothetical protein
MENIANNVLKILRRIKRICKFNEIANCNILHKYSLYLEIKFFSFSPPIYLINVIIRLNHNIIFIHFCKYLFVKYCSYRGIYCLRLFVYVFYVISSAERSITQQGTSLYSQLTRIYTINRFFMFTRLQ